MLYKSINSLCFTFLDKTIIWTLKDQNDSGTLEPATVYRNGKIVKYFHTANRNYQYLPRTLQTIGCKACESLNEVLTHDEYCRWDNVIEPEFSLQDSPCHGNPLKGCKVTTLLKSIKKEELGVNSKPKVKCRGCSTPNKFRDHHVSCQYSTV